MDFQSLKTNIRKFSGRSMLLWCLAVSLALFLVACITDWDKAWIVFLISAAAVVAISLVLFVRSLFIRRFRRRVYLGLAILAGLLVVFRIEEDWRGKWAWERFQAEWEAKGVRFDWQSVVPPPVPDDKNFALAPVVYSTYGRVLDQHGHRKNPPDTNVVDELAALTFDVRSWRVDLPAVPSSGSWNLATKTDLLAWQKYFQLLAETTNLFPVPAVPQTPAKDVLLALSRFDGTLDELRQAAQLPESRFPLEYDRKDIQNCLLPNLDDLHQTANLLSLRAVAELRDNQNDAAYQDVLLSLRLLNAVRDEPFFDSQYLRTRMLKAVLQPVWEALAEHQWSDDQLVGLDEQLVKLDFVYDYTLGMHGEMICTLLAVDRLREEPGLLFAYYPDSEFPASVSVSQRFVGALIPSGWFDQNKVSIGDYMLSYTISAADTHSTTFSPKIIERGNVVYFSDRMPPPYRILERMLVGGIGNTAIHFAWAQASVNMARVAIGLERYRLVHGEYPEKLEALVPQFMATLPQDVIGSQPLHYRRETNGLFTLYSVGWNETDDGGQVIRDKYSETTQDLETGDWVWRYPAN